MDHLGIDWPLWLTTMVPLIFSAGPGNVMVAASGARSGLRRSLTFIYGLDVTYFVLAISVGLGLGQILHTRPILSDAVSAAGICYILYLAWRFWKAPAPGKVGADGDFRFRDGVFVQITNSKGIIMLMVMFSEFFTPSANMATGIVVMSVVLVGLNFSAHLLWASFGMALNSALRRDSRLLRVQNATFAVMMLGIAIWLTLR